MIRYWQQIGPSTWRWVSTQVTVPPPRSELTAPYCISDTMEPTEQVDGRFYTSKAKFRAVGRALGLTEVGNEKVKPRLRSTAHRETKAQRHADLKIAIEKYRAGHRVRRPNAE